VVLADLLSPRALTDTVRVCWRPARRACEKYSIAAGDRHRSSSRWAITFRRADGRPHTDHGHRECPPVGRRQPWHLPPIAASRPHRRRPQPISNIHPPDASAAAARVVAGLVAGARRLGRSGVDLKDTSRADELTAAPTLTLE
jgi:hypothetical protein